jgi:MFS transporter, DHA2 family, multidrug resistance protein
VPAGVPAEAPNVARDTLGGTVSVAGQLPDATGAALLAAQGAFVAGLQLTSAVAGVVAAVIAVVAALALREPAAADDGIVEAEPGLSPC